MTCWTHLVMRPAPSWRPWPPTSPRPRCLPRDHRMRQSAMLIQECSSGRRRKRGNSGTACFRHGVTFLPPLPPPHACATHPPTDPPTGYVERRGQDGEERRDVVRGPACHDDVSAVLVHVSTPLRCRGLPLNPHCPSLPPFLLFLHPTHGGTREPHLRRLGRWAGRTAPSASAGKSGGPTSP